MFGDTRYSMCDSFGENVNFTEDQKKCVDYDGKSVLVIKGTAGSGKSMMVIKRAIEFRKRIIAEDTNEKVIIFTYNKSLMKGILEVLDGNSISLNDGILSVWNADGYLSRICMKMGLLPRNDGPKQGSYDRYGQNRYRPRDNFDYNVVSDDERLEIIRDVLKYLSSKDSSAYLRRNPEFWKDEVLWMYQNGIVDSDDGDRYMSLNREGRCKTYNARLSEAGRSVALKVFDRYNYELMKRRKFEWDRIYAILLRDHVGEIDDGYKFDYMLIDEAQDLSLVKMLLLKSLSRGEINIAMDKNQSLYGHRWSFKNDLGFIPHVKKLQVMHRGTKEIDDFSQDLKRIDDKLLDAEDRYENETSARVSHVLPKIVRCSSADSEMEFVINEVKHLSKQSSNTAILCLDHRHLYQYEKMLRRSGVDCEYFKEDGFVASSPGVKLITVYSAKGLGFVNVIIPNFEEGIYPPSVESVINSLQDSNKDSTEHNDPDDEIADKIAEFRKLAYVGITRAKGNVILTYSGTPSRFIGEFHPEHYILMDEGHNLVTDERIRTSAPPKILRPIIQTRLIPEDVVEKFEPEPESTTSSSVPYDLQSFDVSDEDPLIRLIEQSGAEFVDRRPKGALWVVDGPGVRELVVDCESRGYIFKMAKGGSRATGHRPAFYYEGY